jgi:hypothetical protein
MFQTDVGENETYFISDILYCKSCGFRDNYANVSECATILYDAYIFCFLLLRSFQRDKYIRTRIWCLRSDVPTSPTHSPVRLLEAH